MADNGAGQRLSLSPSSGRNKSSHLPIHEHITFSRADLLILCRLFTIVPDSARQKWILSETDLPSRYGGFNSPFSPTDYGRPPPKCRHASESNSKMSHRRTDLDALRTFAMLLGIALHASLSFFVFPWPIHDKHSSNLLLPVLVAVHGFRMPLFFLLSGYFTMLVFRRRGLAALLEQRFKRIFLPLMIALVTIVPLSVLLERFAIRTAQPDPEFVEILTGNAAAVRARLADPDAATRRDPFWGRSLLAWATLEGDTEIVSALLEAGADIKERDRNGNTLLHFAAVFGRDAVGNLLLKRGADPFATNALGMLPAAGLTLSADKMSDFAPLFDMSPVPVDEILRGRERLEQQLPREPSAEGVLDHLAMSWSQIQSSGQLRLRLGTWTYHPVETNIFYHLWFLWFLCWLVLLFAIMVRCGLTPSGKMRPWLVVASCVPQALMGASLAGGFGPDTSLGLIPKLHVLSYYGCFFFFGCSTFELEGTQRAASGSWKILLPLALVLLAAGTATTNNRLLATFLQPAYAWTMSLGLMGLFSRYLSHPGSSKVSSAVSWMADASYWMYLVHVPLVMIAQSMLRQWSLNAELKFLIILATVTLLLLGSYRWWVRYSWIGRLLNGPTTAPKVNSSLR